MEKLTREQIQDFCSSINSVYGGRKLDIVGIEMWFESLNNYTYEELMKAFSIYVKTKDIPPRISNILEIVREVKLSSNAPTIEYKPSNEKLVSKEDFTSLKHWISFMRVTKECKEKRVLANAIRAGVTESFAKKYCLNNLKG